MSQAQNFCQTQVSKSDTETFESMFHVLGGKEKELFLSFHQVRITRQAHFFTRETILPC